MTGLARRMEQIFFKVHLSRWSGGSMKMRLRLTMPNRCTYAHTKILFNKKGLFRKNKNMIDFHNLQRHINEFGYTTLDLS